MAPVEKKVNMDRMLASYLSQANKILIYAKSFDGGEDSMLLEEKLSSVEDCRNSYKEIYYKYLGVIKDDEVQAAEMMLEAFFDLVDECRYQLKSKIVLFKPEDPKTYPANSSLAGHNNTFMSSEHHFPLPKIPLPTFDGHYENWLYFRGQFNMLVRQNEQLNDRQRLHYLRSCLEGDAKNVGVNEDSFTSLWNALEAAYENKRWLVDKHIEELYSIKVLKTESALGLKSLIENVKKQLRALQSLGLEMNSLSEALLIHHVSSCLDKETVKAYETSHSGTELPKWNDFLSFLANRVRILENLDNKEHKAGGVVDNSKLKQFKKPQSGQNTVSCNSTVKPERNKNRLSCFLCKKPHYLNQCQMFLRMLPAERLKKVVEQKICSNCFSNKHILTNCSSRSCSHCSGRHHTLLHDPQIHPNQSTSSGTTTNVPAILNASSQPFTPSTSGKNNSSVSRNHVAIAHCPNVPNNYPVECAAVSKTFAPPPSNTGFGGGFHSAQSPHASIVPSDAGQASSAAISQFLQPPPFETGTGGGAVIAKVSNVSNKLFCQPDSRLTTCAEHERTDPSSFSQTLLNTAIILVQDVNGEPYECRALLDSAAMSNFMTEKCVRRLKLRKRPSRIQVSGICDSSSSIFHKVSTHVHSSTSAFKTDLDFLVMPKITSDLPLKAFDYKDWSIPSHISLADPNFNLPSRIDVLLGMEIWNDLFLEGKLELTKNLPALRQTVFGWVVGGSIDQDQKQEKSYNFGVVTNEELSEQLRLFWEIEDCGDSSELTVEEQAAEDNFSKTHFRDTNGRYVVQMPFVNDRVELGESRYLALRRFNLLEKRLSRDQQLFDDYCKFLSEYEELNHMTRVGDFEHRADQGSCYFLPHHPVVRPESSTTKLRVVFDASATTTNRKSLNDNLMTGPVTKIQNNLTDTLLRFRLRKIAFCADVEKMFRQISIEKSQRCFQQILWRADKDKPIGIYELNTVTYGTSCAPFLASRTLKQLCLDESQNFPLASKAGLEDFYVDDILSGAETIEDAIRIRKELIALMKRGGFILHKWCSNSPEVLNDIPIDQQEKKVTFSEGTTKTLGISWQPNLDIFIFSAKSIRFNEGVVTMRSVLSDISKFFDPIGLAGPVILVAKMYMQEMWRMKAKWDIPVPEEFLQRWNDFRDQMKAMEDIKVDRCVLPMDNTIKIQLIGFCDASEKGYGACIYVRSIDKSNQVSVSLLCSKSRVTPLKTVTIPRLELCSAHLLAKLISHTTRSLPITIDQVTLFTDSTICLGWIAKCSKSLKTFVSNKVATIQKLTEISSWHHIDTHNNPADIISRGLMPNEIQSCSLWWNGPSFLVEEESRWPIDQHIPADESLLPEMKTVTMATILSQEVFILFERVSSFHKMVRVMSYVLKFVNHCRRPKDAHSVTISIQDRREAVASLVKIVQREAFPDALTTDSSGQVIMKNNFLLTLSIFVDKNQFLRVGGRLRNSSCSDDKKHPLLLPKSHPFTTALIRSYHEENLHAGPQLTLATIRSQYWIVHGNVAVRKVTRACVKCFKVKPRPIVQQMGDLPQCRVEGEYPFYNTGIDFCGPVYVKQHNKRSTVTHKAYISVFVCMATKAIHLELVCDMTSESFLAALDRFTSRRGRPNEIWSDNGTNFVGSNNELNELRRLFMTEQHQFKLTTHCQAQMIQWKFIPPRAPHFGGLWEAGVRSVKHHLKRAIGETCLNHEEMTTILARVEAILNSRPISPISNDPQDLEPLTPGHLLIFRPLNAIDRPDLTELNFNRLGRWQRVTQIVQHVWKRWRIEYLTRLQERHKWHSKVEIAEGQLVIVKEDNVPVQSWLLGRITKLFPGQDGVVRVVNLRTKGGEMKRPVSKLCLLPIDENLVNKC